jgi:ABC-2 type transport system ATP-binding protein
VTAGGSDDLIDDPWPTAIPAGEDSVMRVNANHLRLTLNGRAILRDVSVHIEPGEIYGLLGPNGAGKSTTIAVLLGFYTPDGGKRRLFDGATDDPLALRRRIGVMPEDAGFYGWMSVHDYLAWYAGFYGGLQQPVGELLRLVGLADSGRRPIGQLSRGMRQRLALARALVNAPDLLILDEPTNGLDPRGRREIHDLLLQLAAERRVGVLLCTHLLDDVERLCGRIGILDRGLTVGEGSLSGLLGGVGTGRRFRLRMTAVPDGRSLPPGIEPLRRDGDWWHLGVSQEAVSQLPDLWGALLARGWRYSEIHAEGGGLEELYLRLTSTTDDASGAHAA